MVGGVPYSGKTYFCQRFQERDPQLFPYLETDKLFEAACTDGEVFFRFLPFIARGINDIVQSAFQAQGIAAPEDQLREFDKHMIGTNQKVLLIALKMSVAYAYTAEELMRTDTEASPVFDHLFANIGLRRAFYGHLNRLHMMLSETNGIAPLGVDIGNYPFRDDSPYNLDRVRKVLVYLNPGLDICLQRRRDPATIRSDADQITEQFIQQAYQAQELPYQGELANLEVFIIDEISREKTVDFWIDQLLSKLVP